MITLVSHFAFSYFEGRIYDDGTNKIMLHFESEAGSQKGRNLLNLHYARMGPIRSKFAIPTDQPVQVIGGFCNSSMSSFTHIWHYVLMLPCVNVPVLSLNFTELQCFKNTSDSAMNLFESVKI